MRHSVILNNYQIGAKLKTAPIHKIIKQGRISSKATKVVFEELTRNEIILCEKLFGSKFKEDDDNAQV